MGFEPGDLIRYKKETMCSENCATCNMIWEVLQVFEHSSDILIKSTQHTPYMAKGFERVHTPELFEIVNTKKLDYSDGF